jgi:hypothetical protein
VRYGSDHLLIECPQFAAQRQELVGRIGSVGLGFTAKNILNPPKQHHNHVYGALEIFILECKLTDKI